MKTSGRVLYERVTRAREHCCGDAPRERMALLKDVDSAISFAYQVEASEAIIMKLNEARRIIVQSTSYVDRIPADNLLCELLNVDLQGFALG